MRDLAKALRSLSDETRLRILKLLMERECCVCEVMQAMDISQTRASRNLSILEEAGFVKSRRDGLWVVHSVDEKGMKKYCADLTRIINDALEGNEVASLDRERLKTAGRVGPAGVRQMKKMT